MSELIDSVTTGLAFQGRERGEDTPAPSVPPFSEDLVNLSIPSRGIVLAVLISGFLWTGIILAGRALWLVIR